MPHKLKALLFDIDGTLCDTDHIHLQVWADLLKPKGIDCDMIYYISHISGAANVHLSKKYWPELSEEQRHELMTEKETNFRKIAADQLVPLPGLLDLIHYGRDQGLKVALVTNAPRENAVFIVDKLKLNGLFDDTVIGGELPESKPHPLPYLTAMKHFGVQPDECLVFEDSVSGVTAGYKSKAMTIGILTSQKEQTLLDAGAAVCIKDFTAIQLNDNLLQLKDFIKKEQ